MDHFRDLVHTIARRPGLYVGVNSLRAVSQYLDGYDHAVMEITGCASDERPLYGWMRYVGLRFLISHPAWHWTRILLYEYGSDKAALEALPKLYDQFVEQRSSIGVEGIEVELRRQIIAKYGRDWHEPDITTTVSSL